MCLEGWEGQNFVVAEKKGQEAGSPMVFLTV